MPEQSANFLSQAGDVIKYVLVAALSLIGWNLKRQVSRIDKLEDNVLPKDSLNKTIDSVSKSIDSGFKNMKDDMNVMHTQTRLDIREIHKRIDGIVKK